MYINLCRLRVIITALFLATSNCLAYDRVVHYEDSDKIIFTSKIYEYEKDVLAQIAIAVKKLSLPEDTKFNIVVRQNGRIEKLAIESSEITPRDKSWSLRALRRLKFKPPPDIIRGTITMKISLKELKNPPYRHDSGVDSGTRGNNFILLSNEQIRKDALEQIERLKYKSAGPIIPFSKVASSCQIIRIAARHNIPEEVKESISTINAIVDKNRSIITDRYAIVLAWTASDLSKYKQYQNAASLLSTAIQVQTNGDSYFNNRPKVRLMRCMSMRDRKRPRRYTIENHFRAVERSLRRNEKFKLLAQIEGARVKQLSAMSNVDYGLLGLKKIDWAQALLFLANQDPQEKKHHLKKSNEEFASGLKAVAAKLGYDSDQYKEAAMLRRKDLEFLKLKAYDFDALP